MACNNRWAQRGFLIRSNLSVRRNSALHYVMPGLVPGIHVLTFSKKDVDGRDI
jgi:hypothetical protein